MTYLASHLLSSVRVFLICIVVVAAFAAVISEAAMIDSKQLGGHERSPHEPASRINSATSISPFFAPLFLTVNIAADTADSSAGDGHCDIDGNPGNGDQCTLRASIQEANAQVGDDSVTFDPSISGSTISLNSPLPDINSNLVITGPGASLLRVGRSTAGGTPNFRVFNISSTSTVSMSGLTVSNGKVDNNGGGILNQGVLTLTRVTISGNNADFGGGIFNMTTGTLNLTESIVASNTTIGGSAAGILSQGTLNVSASAIVNNTVGGGVFVGGGTSSFVNSTISNNTDQGSGAGLTITGSAANTHTIVNCTISGNRADTQGNSGGIGGGIVRLIGIVHLRNTIVAGNVRGSVSLVPDDIAGTIDSASSFNLIGTGGSGGLTDGVNQNKVGIANPGLGGVSSSNGGPTPTQRLLAGSAAIDAGDNCVLNNSCTPSTGSSLTTDQRGTGFNRLSDGNGDGTATVDIGAYEAQIVLVGPPILVTNTADSGVGSLREAVLDANANPSGTVVNFQAGLSGTIQLLNELPHISSPMIVKGPGAGQLTVQRSTAGGTPSFRIFTIDPGANATISGLTLSNGIASGSSPANNGGGILNQGTLSLSDSVVNGNHADVSGGGVANLGTLTLRNTLIANNSATSSGGGVANSTGATQSAVLAIDKSTISNNSSQAGGGIFNIGQAAVTNSTISTNTSVTGGGINNFNPMTLASVTIVNNSATNQGGGIYNPGIGTLTFGNTLIAGNTAPSGPDGSGANLISQDYNLIGNTSGLQINGTTLHNITNVDARIGPLANNGGPTPTHDLLEGSPAIDTGFTLLQFDQRGESRPIDNPTAANAGGGNASDIGAYETPIFQVNSTADTDDGSCTLKGAGNGCTLREVLNAANAVTGTKVITFAAALTSSGPATINLLSSLPNLSSDMTIAGSGANLLTVQRSSSVGTPNFRIFTINFGRTVTITNLTISNGNTTGIGNGGGVLNDGTLTMADCNLYGNRAGAVGSGAGLGGGVYNSGSLTLTNCNLGGLSSGQGNSVGASGGGLFTSGSLSMNGGSLVGNQGDGGNLGGTATLNGVAITNNTEQGNGGAGLLVRGTALIVNSLIANNVALGGAGGGIRNGNGIVNLVNSTVFGNSSVEAGGGIMNFNATMTLTNVTVTNNQADSDNNSSGGESSGGVHPAGGPLKLNNTIVAGNFRGSTGSPTPDDVNSGLDPSSSFNLIGVCACGLTNGVNNNQIGLANAGLLSLADNGGPTRSVALQTTSPALDAGSNALVVNPPFTDQRGAGFSRIVDGPDGDATSTVDIGAYERQVALINIADTSTNEDTQLIVPFAIDRGSIISITVSSSNSALIPNDAAHLRVTDAGSEEVITINPADNLSGVAVITVNVNRTAGSISHAFTVTVNAVNDAPSFIKGADQTVNEDAGSQTVSSWATGLSSGPVDESGQSLTFQVTNNSNAALFSAGPAINSTGTLTYTPAANANGSAIITIALKDSGGVANGGNDTSTPQTFTINVNPVNDAPTFTKGPNQNVNNNAGPRTVNNWATAISAGAANESGQTLTFLVTGNSNPDLFSDAPAITSTGTLTYTPATNAAGSATITIVLKDNGGIANGGQDTSPSQTFTISTTAVGGSLRFSSSNFSTTEASGFTTITAVRTGDTSLPVTVDYATAGDSTSLCSTVLGVASHKCDFTAALGTLRFAAGETTKTFTVLISQDSYVEGPESLSLALSNATGFAVLGTPSTATLTISDDPSEPITNPIDDAAIFVRQHYHDFLNREPDAPGLAFWTNEITSCGADVQCVEIKRINVSAAFFLSIEFQETGYLTHRIYKTAFGDTTSPNVAVPVPIIRLNEFIPDTQKIANGVNVGIGDWEAQLEANKTAYALEFVSRQRFLTAYPLSMSAAQVVDKLDQNAGGVLSSAERDQLIAELIAATNVTAARGSVLRKVAENAQLRQLETSRAFVLMEYYGYMRRNPDDPQDTDFGGWAFWLNKLNQFNGNFVQAEMVKAFISSSEYRRRFGQ